MRQTGAPNESWCASLHTSTPITDRLAIELDAEFLRMANEWFFKWHQIGADSSAEIDDFNGGRICYGGIKFSGTARDVYWQTIERYLRKKVGDIFDRLEQQLKNYPIHIRRKALKEARNVIVHFAMNIRKAAVEKDRILRGDGINFPPQQDLGRWEGSRPFEIEDKIKSLTHIYCDIPDRGEDFQLPFEDMMNDKVTLVNKEGEIVEENLPASVQSSKIFTMKETVPISAGDHFLRKLPSGLVEDFEVIDPGFFASMTGMPGHYQSEVRRVGTPSQKGEVIQQITNNFHGHNSRVNINSTDNSTNVVNEIQWTDVAKLLEQVKPAMDSLPSPQREQLAEPIALLEDEIRSGKPDQSKMRQALMSMKTIAEGVTGNLIAAGIVGMIANVF